jgi:hypothetical protein
MSNGCRDSSEVTESRGVTLNLGCWDGSLHQWIMPHLVHFASHNPLDISLLFTTIFISTPGLYGHYPPWWLHGNGLKWSQTQHIQLQSRGHECFPNFVLTYVLRKQSPAKSNLVWSFKHRMAGRWGLKGVQEPFIGHQGILLAPRPSLWLLLFKNRRQMITHLNHTLLKRSH